MKNTLFQQNYQDNYYSKKKKNDSIITVPPPDIKNQKDFAMFMLNKGYMISSIKKYICDIELFIRWANEKNLVMKEIGYNNILNYIHHIKPMLVQKTIACKINSIKHFFNFLIDTDQHSNNPADGICIKGIKKRILYKLLSVNELEELYFNFLNNRKKSHLHKNRFAPDMLVSKRNKIILGLVIYQALSTREISDLEVKDIMLKEGKILIRGNRRSNPRMLKLEAHQIMEIKDYFVSVRKKIFEQTRKSGKKLFASTGCSNDISNIFKKFIKSINKQNKKIYSFRQIRSSVISGWLKLYNLRHVQYMIGHRYVSSTEVYHLNQTDSLCEDISRFHPIY